MRKLEPISRVWAKLRARHPHVAAELCLADQWTNQSAAFWLSPSPWKYTKTNSSRTCMQCCHRVDPLLTVITSVWSRIRVRNTDSCSLQSCTWIICIWLHNISYYNIHVRNSFAWHHRSVLFGWSTHGLIHKFTSAIADNYCTHSHTETLTALRKMLCYSERRVDVSCDSTVLGWKCCTQNKKCLWYFPKNWQLLSVCCIKSMWNSAHHADKNISSSSILVCYYLSHMTSLQVIIISSDCCFAVLIKFNSVQTNKSRQMN